MALTMPGGGGEGGRYMSHAWYMIQQSFSLFLLSFSFASGRRTSVPVFLNFNGAQESIPRKSIPPAYVAWRARARTFKCLWGSGIDSKEWIPPAYVAWRAGTITQFLLGS